MSFFKGFDQIYIEIRYPHNMPTWKQFMSRMKAPYLHKQEPDQYKPKKPAALQVTSNYGMFEFGYAYSKKTKTMHKGDESLLLSRTPRGPIISDLGIVVDELLSKE